MMDYRHNVNHEVIIPLEGAHLEGILFIPEHAVGLVLFAHGSGSSRFSTRNQFVAKALNNAGIATLLFDLLTPEEDEIDSRTAELRFDIEFLALRLRLATDWTVKQPTLQKLPLGYFGASTGGGAALVAASKIPQIKAVVSRGGRPDLATVALPHVQAPTLLIVGGNDDVVIGMNEEALAQLRCTKKIEIIPGATHLFEEPGTLEEVARLAKEWFLKYLKIT